MAKKYSTVTVTPTIVKAAFDDNDVMGDFVQLPLPVRDGESVMLKNISIVDAEDLGKDLDIVFVKNVDGDAELGTSGSAVDITDANLNTNVFLGVVVIDFSAGASDLIGSQVSTVKDVNMILTSSNQTATTGAAESQTGCYFGLIAREATDTSSGSNDHLTITFGFETL
mgnify:CR=1 FL=1